MKTVASAAMMAAILMGGLQCEGAEITCEPAVMKQAWALLKLARYGNSDQEQAAFIVRDAAGRHSLQAWSNHHTFRSATYEGSAPAAAVAIIHTHPNYLPYPSDDDKQTALRTGMPVYVLTRTMISRTTGQVVEQVWSGDWNLESPRNDVPALCAARVAEAAGLPR